MPTSRRRRKENPRKAEFLAALALNRTTAGAWATEHGVKHGHLSQVLNGLRESGRLDAAIDAYIADFRQRVAATAGGAAGPQRQSVVA